MPRTEVQKKHSPLAVSPTDEVVTPDLRTTLAPKPEPEQAITRRQTGDLVAGEMVAEYQVTAKIGEGGMGKVYAGVQPLIGKKVAIKLLQPNVASNPEVVNRFVQEARAVNQIRSRYIVDIFSFGELDRGLRYFVMEYIDGTPLRKFLQARGRLFFEEAYSILRAVTKGLGAAHGVGIVHRDLKPENIIVVDDDDGLNAKILDFGIAKLTGTSASTPGFATETGMTLGTPYYMSPEQARGVGVDSRTDIYALGVIMFEMFTGVLPFEAKSYIDLVNKHLFAPVPDASKLANDVPEQLSSLIKCCMAKDPAERPQRVEHILDELKAMAPSLAGICFATSATLAQVKSAPDIAQPPGTTGPHQQDQARPAGRRSGGIYIVVGVLLAAAIGGGLYYALLSPDSKALPPATTAPEVNSAAERAKIPAVPSDAGRATPALGRLLVESNANAVYKIDGATIGEGTRLDYKLRPGSYSLEITSAGRKPLTERILIVAGRPLSLKRALPKKKKKKRYGASRKPSKSKVQKTPVDSDGTLNPFKKR